MKLAVSNIAWLPVEESEVAEILVEHGVTGVEIAPTKVFDDPLQASNQDIESYQEFWAERDIDVVAFQSLLFGRPDLQLFGDRATRDATVQHLERFIELAGRFGAESLVFGSPKNRLVPDDMLPTEAWEIAVEAFTYLGSLAEKNGTCFCIEPNPANYGCNFVTSASSGLDLVRQVDNPGFRLHLDAAGMALAGDEPADAVRAAGDWLQHYHVSAPNLMGIELDVVDHSAAASALRDIRYSGWISIEMRSAEVGENPARVDQALELTRKAYAL